MWLTIHLVKNKPCLEWPICGVRKVFDLLRIHVGLNPQIGRPLSRIVVPLVYFYLYFSVVDKYINLKFSRTHRIGWFQDRKCDFDSHECDFATNECEFDFYNVVLRHGVRPSTCKLWFLNVECDFDIHEC
jgi:hypothetical protein